MLDLIAFINFVDLIILIKGCLKGDIFELNFSKIENPIFFVKNLRVLDLFFIGSGPVYLGSGALFAGSWCPKNGFWTLFSSNLLLKLWYVPQFDQRQKNTLLVFPQKLHSVAIGG